jgi:hypothetical protein
VIGTLLCFVVGGLLVGVSVRKDISDRIFGPGLTAQYKFGKRISRRFRLSERSVFNRARLFRIIFGSLAIVVGIASLVEQFNGAR